MGTKRAVWQNWDVSGVRVRAWEACGLLSGEFDSERRPNLRSWLHRYGSLPAPAIWSLCIPLEKHSSIESQEHEIAIMRIGIHEHEVGSLSSQCDYINRLVWSLKQCHCLSQLAVREFKEAIITKVLQSRRWRWNSEQKVANQRRTLEIWINAPSKYESTSAISSVIVNTPWSKCFRSKWNL